MNWPVLRELGGFFSFLEVGWGGGGGARQGDGQRGSGVWWYVENPLTALVLHGTSTAKFNLIWTVDFTGEA